MFRHEKGHDAALEYSSKSYLDTKIKDDVLNDHKILGERPNFK